MNNQTDKMMTHQMLLDNKEGIIQKYNNGTSVWDIAKEYKVAESTIYIKLSNWGVRKKGIKTASRRRIEIKETVKFKRNFSPELIAKMKENTRINKKGVKHFTLFNTKADSRLIQNILGSNVTKVK